MPLIDCLILRGFDMFHSSLLFVVCITSSFTSNIAFDFQNESAYIDNSSAVTDVQRKYGLSLNHGCGSYNHVFKCLTTCKSMGFQIYRLNYKCKCTCHQKKISITLPYFRWLTTGTTKKAPPVQSPPLWSVVGTLSPLPKKRTKHANNITLSTPSSCDPVGTTPSYQKEQTTIDAAQLNEDNTTTVQPDSNNTVLPDSTNTVLPDSITTVLPDSTNTVLPDDTNTVLPDSTNTVLPDSTNTVLPDSTNTVLPDSATTVLPDITTTDEPAN